MLALNALLDDVLDPSARQRCRVEMGRVKSANRLLAKAQREKYSDRIKKPDDIFTVIDDIVGTRITCNTVSDVYSVAKILNEYCASTIEDRTLTALPATSKDFISNPKESGYRAAHINVEIDVPTGRRHEKVVCEVQIRTLLQHAWGEITHEDTYKPGVTPPVIVEVLAKRLATTLAVMDEIAQDLRDELDRVAADVADANKTPPSGTPSVEPADADASTISSQCIP